MSASQYQFAQQNLSYVSCMVYNPTACTTGTLRLATGSPIDQLVAQLLENTHLSQEEPFTISHEGRYLRDQDVVDDSFHGAILVVEPGEAPFQNLLEQAPWRAWLRQVDFGHFAELPGLDVIDRKVLGIDCMAQQDLRKLRFPLKLADLPSPSRLPSLAKNHLRRVVDHDMTDTSDGLDCCVWPFALWDMLDCLEDSPEALDLFTSVQQWPATWGPPNTDDIVFGKIQSAEPNFAEPTRRPSIVVFTTFPVGDSIWAHRDSTEYAPRLAHSAERLAFLQDTVLDNCKDAMAWLDSNPCPRPAGEKTTRSSELELIFPYSEAVLDSLDPDIVWVQQETNRELIITRLGPTHVSRDWTMPDFSNALPGHAAENFDRVWHWDFGTANHCKTTTRQRWRPITRSEQALWFHLNVLDASRLLPFAPRSLFVRRYRGYRDRLLVFSPHICLVDQIRYPAHFLEAVEETSRSAAAIASLFPPSRTSLEVADQVSYALRNPGFDSVLSRRFGLNGLAGKAFADARRNDNNIVKALTEVRRREIKTGVAYSFETLGPALRQLAAHLCLGSNDINRLQAYTVRPGKLPPPSILSDMLSALAKSTVHALANLEKIEAAGHLDVFDSVQLDRARKDNARKQRLKDSLNLTISVASPVFFSTASRVQGYQSGQDVRVATRLRLAFVRAGPNAVHWWSIHCTQDLALSRGFFRSLKSGAISIAWGHFYRLDEVCARCRDSAWGRCIVPYHQAVVEGWAASVTSDKLVAEAVRAALLVAEEQLRQDRRLQDSGRSRQLQEWYGSCQELSEYIDLLEESTALEAALP